jgi:RNA polymerase sigma-70 factor (ECF subfamily)
MNTDEQLLDAARKFDPEALRTIFDSYSSHIFNFALRLCQDSAEADNIVGDVFALLLERLAQGQGPTSNLRSYLFQIAYHRIVDGARARKHTAPLETADFTHHEEISLAQQAEDDLMLATVIKAMQTELTPDQYQVLVLRFVEEFNIHETAEIMGKNVNNVKVIQSRAIEKLRQATKR